MIDWGSLFKVVRLLADVLGIVGGFFGVVSWILVAKERKRIRQEEDKLWQKYVNEKRELTKGDGNVWNPEIGSDDHKDAERMVDRGWLKRAPMGGYCLYDLRF